MKLRVREGFWRKFFRNTVIMLIVLFVFSVGVFVFAKGYINNHYVKPAMIHLNIDSKDINELSTEDYNKLYDYITNEIDSNISSWLSSSWLDSLRNKGDYSYRDLEKLKFDNDTINKRLDVTFKQIQYRLDDIKPY